MPPISAVLSGKVADSHKRNTPMLKPNYQFEKRQREQEKKKKKAEKVQRKTVATPEAPTPPEPPSVK
jgi:hypothetical protein